jgi:cytochrome c biogenesis protein CcmG, thiol:disulfide interchange protein DsbE
MLNKKFISIFGILILITFFIVFLSFIYNSLAYTPLPLNEPVPNINLKALTGDYFKFEHTRKEKYILIYFTTECGYCRIAMTNFNELQNEFREEIIILGVSGSTISKTNSFIHEYDISFPVLIDDYRVVKSDYGVQAVPAIYLIDEELILRGYRSGHRSLQTDRNWITTLLFENHTVNEE